MTIHIWFEDFHSFVFTPAGVNRKMTKEQSVLLNEKIKKHGNIINIGIMSGF